MQAAYLDQKIIKLFQDQLPERDACSVTDLAEGDCSSACTYSLKVPMLTSPNLRADQKVTQCSAGLQASGGKASLVHHVLAVTWF